MARLAPTARLALVVAILTVPSVVSAQGLANGLIGTWQGTGVVTGLPSTIDMRWERVLGGRFLRLTFRNDMRTPDGRSQLFEGHAYYRVAPEGWSGTWYDSRGLAFPVAGHTTADRLESAWGSATTEQGQTVYRLVDADTMEVVDSVRGKDGTLKAFGKSRLKRVKNASEATRPRS